LWEFVESECGGIQADRGKAIAVITIIIVSTVATALIWVLINENPPNSRDDPLDIVYGEAPMLNELVDNGTLPPVEERLPTNPMLIQPEEEVGVYGGTWRMGMKGVGGYGAGPRNCRRHSSKKT